MNNFPKIETERLILKRLKLQDAPLIAKYAGDRKVSEFTLNIPFPYQEKDAIWWINHSFNGFEKNTHYTFGIYLKETREFIGGVSLLLDLNNKKASLGYWVAVPFWNKGFMTEAVKAIIKFGFTSLNLNKIFAQHLIENEASGKVMQKAGMTFEATFDQKLKEDFVRRVSKFVITINEFNNKQQ